jgi:hypothetical protein
LNKNKIDLSFNHRMQKISNQLLQAINFEISFMKKALREKQGIPEEYEELHRIIKARSTRVS